MGLFCPKRKLYVVLLGAVAAFCFTPRYAQAQESGEGLPAEGQILSRSEGGELLTLERCIDIALEKNPEIAASQWDISAASSRLDIANSAFWPQMALAGGAAQYVNNQRLIQARYNGEPGVFDDQMLRGDLLAMLNLYAGGRMVSESGAADKLSEAEKKKFIRTREELTYSVTAVYFALLGQHKIISSLQFSMRALEEHMKRVQQLYEAQKVARVDILRTEVRLTNLKQNLLKEENTLAVQKRILFTLMGLDRRLEDVRFEEKTDSAEKNLELVRLVETALKNRPDYLAAHNRMEAQTFRVTAAKAGHLPSINLVGSYGVRNAPNPEDQGKSTKASEDTGSVGIVLTLPLFEGGRVSAKVSEETAALGAVRERLRKMELQIRQETETAFLEVLSNQARVKAIEKSIEQAEESFRIESLKYELGKGSITDVLDAQAAQLEAETTYYRAAMDYHISMARLTLATGGTL